MKTLAITLLLPVWLFSTSVMAGAGHSHAPDPINQQIAEKKAAQIIASLVKEEKIDKSWLSRQANSTEKKVVNGNPEWVVLFSNEAMTDLDKQQLYVSLTTEGEYISVNYLPAIPSTEHGHSHAQMPIDQQIAEKKAAQIIASLVEREKIDKSWSSKQVNSVEKKAFNDNLEWVVTFNNETIADLDKQKLYVFLTINGEYIAANYTGK